MANILHVVQGVEREEAGSPFRRLKSDEPVSFASESCLIVRRPGMACGLCRDACPAAVISGGQWSILIEMDGCMGCGVCAAACPTGALVVDGFAPQTPAAPSERIVLECRRVGGTDLDPDAVVVPCLGGLTTPDLLDLAVDGDVPIVLSDHGWCLDCPIGRSAAPWQEALDEARTLLAAVETEMGLRIAVERKVLPADRADPPMQALRPDKRVNRRDLLLRLVHPDLSGDDRAESRRVVMGRGPVVAAKRGRILERIGALAASLERQMPAMLMPAIRIAEGCEVSGLCAAICPTGALSRDEDDDAVSLRFDAVGCIACGECQRVCPSKALGLWAAGDGMVARGATTPVTRRKVVCANCGSGFVASGDDDLCPPCRKTTEVMQQIVSLRYRPSMSIE